MFSITPQSKNRVPSIHPISVVSVISVVKTAAKNVPPHVINPYQAYPHLTQKLLGGKKVKAL